MQRSVKVRNAAFIPHRRMLRCDGAMKKLQVRVEVRRGLVLTHGYMANALSNLTLAQLERAVELRSQIEVLENQVSLILGTPTAVRAGRPSGRPPGRRPGRPPGPRGPGRPPGPPRGKKL